MKKLPKEAAVEAVMLKLTEQSDFDCIEQLTEMKSN